MDGFSTLEARLRPNPIITGEAVPLEISPASVLARVGAYTIDALTMIAIMVTLLTFSMALAPDMDISYRTALISILLMLVILVLPASIEYFSRGKSFGKLVFGLQVVRDDGMTLRWRHCFTRALVALVEIIFTTGSVALLVAIASKRTKRLGDYLAGTVVVRVPEPIAPVPLLMPPDLAPWARVAQIRPLSDIQAWQCRQFLQTSGSMNPSARYRVGMHLAAQLQDFVSPPPPAGINPERFIAAVLVVRRDRDYAQILARDTRLERSFAQQSQLPFGISPNEP